MKNWNRLFTTIIVLSTVQSWAIAAEKQQDYKLQLQTKAFNAIANRQKPITEATYREASDWFGKTGLPDSVERSLPRQIRQQLGQFVGDKDSIKARDLHYVGAYPVLNGKVHYWELPAEYNGKSSAYLLVDSNDQMTFGLAETLPPKLE